MTFLRFFCSLGLLLALLLSTFAGLSWSASYTGGFLTDQANGFKIKVPGNWNRQEMSNQRSNTHLFVSPDQNVAVAVTTFPGSGSTNLQQLLNTFQQTTVAGAQQLAVEPTDLNGLNGMLGAYRVQDANGPVITGAFATQSNGNGYVVWSMIPETLYNSRFTESDAIMNTFVLTGKKSQPKPKAAQKAKVQTRPLNQPQVIKQAPQQMSEQKPVPAKHIAFQLYHEPTCEISVPYPQGWQIETTQSSVTIGGPEGTDAYETTINLQSLRRSDPANRDLTTTVSSFTKGFKNAGARISHSEATTVNGAASWHIYAVAETNGATHAFRYLLIERPQVIAVVSFVAPVMKWNDYLSTVEQIEAGIVLDAIQQIAPAVAKTTPAPVAQRTAAVTSVNLGMFPIFTPYTVDSIPASLASRPSPSAFSLPSYDAVEDKSDSMGMSRKIYEKNGNLVAVEGFKGGQPHSLSLFIKNGGGRIYVEFWSDGSISNVDYYEGMDKQGVARFWDTDGTLAKIATYSDNKLDGSPSISWARNANHRLTRVEHQVNGVRHGVMQTYHSNGQLEEHSVWKNGRKLWQKLYFRSGELRADLKDNGHGKSIGAFYNEDGSINTIYD